MSKYKYEISTDKNPTDYKIYLATSPSGKQYVGMTTQKIEERIRQHNNTSLQNKKNAFSNAIRKYEINNINFKVIDYANSIEELKELEKYYIRKYDTYENGYNCTLGGEGTNGFKMSKEQKAKISENITKYFEDPNNREAQSQRIKQYFQSEENKIKNSNSVIQAYIDNPKLRENLSKIKIKHFENKENREKMSNIKKQLYIDNPELKTVQSNRMKNFYINEENRKNISKKRKEFCQDRSNRELLSLSHGINNFFVYDKNGNYIGEWHSIALCAEDLNIKRQGISKCLKGKSIFVKDYVFINKDNFSNEKLSLLTGKANESRFSKKEFSVYTKSINPEFVNKWQNQIECARILNLQSQNINNCLLGRRLFHKDYIFVYTTENEEEELNKIVNLIYDKNKFINMYNKQTKELINTFQTVKDIANNYQLDDSSVRKCLRGEKQYYKNYEFYYIENDIYLKENKNNLQEVVSQNATSFSI